MSCVLSTYLYVRCNWLYVFIMSRTPFKMNPNYVSLAKWLSVQLRTRWFWVRVQLQSFKLDSIPPKTKNFYYWIFRLKDLMQDCRCRFQNYFCSHSFSFTFTFCWASNRLRLMNKNHLNAMNGRLSVLGTYWKRKAFWWVLNQNCALRKKYLKN